MLARNVVLVSLFYSFVLELAARAHARPAMPADAATTSDSAEVAIGPVAMPRPCRSPVLPTFPPPDPDRPSIGHRERLHGGESKRACSRFNFRARDRRAVRGWVAGDKRVLGLTTRCLSASVVAPSTFTAARSVRMDHSPRSSPNISTMWPPARMPDCTSFGPRNEGARRQSLRYSWGDCRRRRMDHRVLRMKVRSAFVAEVAFQPIDRAFE
jgi:hypothetical protein